MNIYQCDAIIEQIEELACQQEGELTEEQLQQIVEAHTGSIESLERMCGYIKHLEHGVASCKVEEARIKEMRTKADARIKSIKLYLTPYVAKKGKQDVGTFKLSMRTSKSVVLDEWFDLDKECNQPYVKVDIKKTPKKKEIKEALQQGIKIAGASISTNQNLQFK